MIFVFIIIFFIIFYFYRRETFNNNHNKIKKLIRQSSRFSLAAEQDLNPLIKILHSNYGAAYLFALKDIFSETEINDAIGGKNNRLKFESEVIKIQDKTSKEVINYCPSINNQNNFLSKLAGKI